MRGLEKDLFPFIGAMTLPTITAPILLVLYDVLKNVGSMRRLIPCGRACQVFLYGVQTGRCDRSPALDLHGALKPVIVTNMAAMMEPHKVGELMRAIDGYSGQPARRAALATSTLLFHRPGNIRQMECSWINFDDAMLTIPSQDMKRRVHQKINGRPHLVPLAPQALAFLTELRPLTGHGRYVFPSLPTGERPMSENTVNAALRRMGYSQDEMSAHGFRATARTLMIERKPGISADVIEAQFAHGKFSNITPAFKPSNKLCTGWTRP